MQPIQTHSFPRSFTKKILCRITEPFFNKISTKHPSVWVIQVLGNWWLCHFFAREIVFKYYIKEYRSVIFYYWLSVVKKSIFYSTCCWKQPAKVSALLFQQMVILIQLNYSIVFVFSPPICLSSMHLKFN